MTIRFCQQSSEPRQVPNPQAVCLLSRWFSKLDLSHVYLQVPLDESSQQYVTINTHRGLFQYTRLPFRVSSAPSIFQRVMENLLQGIPGVCVYLDDILVTGASDQEHLENLAHVLCQLKTARMKLKEDKCAFLLPSVTYMGHVISAQGLHTEDSKVKAVVDAPAPRDVTALRSFLGMVNYYGRFLPYLPYRDKSRCYPRALELPVQMCTSVSSLPSKSTCTIVAQGRRRPGWQHTTNVRHGSDLIKYLTK